jgi:hypothetical protein
MMTTHNDASGYNMQYPIKKILTAEELQDVLSLLTNWLKSGKLRISYYHFILICDMLQFTGVKIDKVDDILKYIAAYLLLSKSEEIMDASIECLSCETNQRMNELIHTAVQEAFSNLDLLISHLFADS